MALNMSVLTLCKFTPLGFETFINIKLSVLAEIV